MFACSLTWLAHRGSSIIFLGLDYRIGESGVPRQMRIFGQTLFDSLTQITQGHLRSFFV
jgi:hypothetical protein